MQNNKNPLFNRTKQCCDYSCKSSKPLSEKQEHCAVFSFFFFSVCNSGCAIIKPYSIWQDRVSQVVIFLYFWHGTFFDKKVAPVLAVTECYRCDNIHVACERLREREQTSEKRICLWHLRGIDRAVRRGVRRNPTEQVLPLSLCLLFSKKNQW